MLASGGRQRLAGLLGALALACVTWWTFAGVGSNESIRLDDPTYVYENPHVLGGLTREGLRWAFTTNAAANWHPLTWISHMLDVELFGADAGAHHRVSLGLHVLNALLVFALLVRWTGAGVRAWFVAALFALHPLRVESVAWTAERKDVLSIAFLLAALHAWTSWTRAGGAWRYALVVASLALGLMSKPMLVTAPFLLLLLDVWPLQRLEFAAPGSWRALWPRVREKLALFALVLLACGATYVAQSTWGAVVTRDALPIGMRVGNALISYVVYLAQSVRPVELAIYYPYPRTIDVAFASFAALGLAFATWWFVRARARRPWLLVGWLWYLGTLVPVIGIVQVGQQAHADRYTYLPSIGIAWMFVWELAEYARTSFGTSSRGAGRGLVVLGVILLGLLARQTREQVALWRDSISVFGHAVAVTGDNAMARQNLGNSLLAEGDLQGALRELGECVRISPAFPDARSNLASVLGALGRNEEALQQLREALRLGQDGFNVRLNLGQALFRLGRAEEALVEYRRAIELDPRDARGPARLGVALAALGRLEEARTAELRALELDPRDEESRRTLALVAMLLGRDDEAIAGYRSLLATRADDVETRKNLAWVLATSAQAALRDGKEARALVEAALASTRADDARAHDVLAAACAESGDFATAELEAARAVELHRSQGRTDKATEVGERLELYRRREAFHRR